MAYKRREFFIDDDFVRFLDHIEAEADGPIELVLNGDIFDFDNVTQLPDEPAGPVDWLARLRGLSSEEWMSEFKMDCIIRDHPRWFRALSAFLERGNRAVFIVGNHDVELLWPAVQSRILEALGVDADVPYGSLPPPPALPASGSAGAGVGSSVARRNAVVFCNWFYLSGDDTYISHGHQYDPNCVVKNPIDPLIEVRGRPRIRIPFGNLAGRYMLNGMGYFNPNAKDNYIMSALQYVQFFMRYMVRTQPLMLWTWFWGALVTLLISLRDHWRPAMRDPLLVDDKVRAIAERSGATPSMVRKLNALSVPAACTRPLVIFRELWLDRAFLLLALFFGAWQMVLHVNIAWPISPAWVFVPLALFLPPYALYARQIKSTVDAVPLLSKRRASLIARITGAKNVIFGHTHEPLQEQLGPVRYLNGGFWSAAFSEPDCLRRIGTQTFVWIRPAPQLAASIQAAPQRAARTATLYEWPPGAEEARVFAAESQADGESLPPAIEAEAEAVETGN